MANASMTYYFEVLLKNEKFKASVKETKEVMEELPKAFQARFQKVTDAVNNLVKTSTKNLTNLSSKSISSLKGMSFALTGLFLTGFKASKDFNREFSQVQTLIGSSPAKVRALQESIINLSTTTGVSSKELSKGIYQVISAFGEANNNIKQLEVVTKAATAGGAETVESLNLLSAVTKAYGDTSEEALKKVADLAFQTVKDGQTSFSELASSMQQVTSISQTLGISQEELFNVFSTLTGVLGSASEVATKFKAAQRELIKPNENLANIISKTGFNSGDAMVKTLGFKGSLDKIKEIAVATGKDFNKLFTSTEALQIALSLTGAQSDIFSKKLKNMHSSTGATEEAFKDAQGGANSFNTNLNKLINSLTNLGIKISNEILPAFNPLLNLLNNVIAYIASLDSSTLNLIASFTSFGVGGLLLLNTISNIGSSFGTLTGAIKKATTIQTAYNAVLTATQALMGFLPVALLAISLLGLSSSFSRLSGEQSKYNSELKEKIKLIEEEKLKIESSLSSYENIINKTSQTKEEKKKLLEIERDLLEKYPNLTKEVIRQAGAYSKLGQVIGISAQIKKVEAEINTLTPTLDKVNKHIKTAFNVEDKDIIAVTKSLSKIKEEERNYQSLKVKYRDMLKTKNESDIPEIQNQLNKMKTLSKDFSDNFNNGIQLDFYKILNKSKLNGRDIEIGVPLRFENLKEEVNNLQKGINETLKTPTKINNSIDTNIKESEKELTKFQDKFSKIKLEFKDDQINLNPLGKALSKGADLLDAFLKTTDTKKLEKLKGKINEVVVEITEALTNLSLSSINLGFERVLEDKNRGIKTNLENIDKEFEDKREKWAREDEERNYKRAEEDRARAELNREKDLAELEAKLESEIDIEKQAELLKKREAIAREKEEAIRAKEKEKEDKRILYERALDEYNLKKEQAKLQQQLADNEALLNEQKKWNDFAQAGINGALAITKIWSTTPDPTGITQGIMTGIITGITSAQMGIIGSKKIDKKTIPQPKEPKAPPGLYQGGIVKNQGLRGLDARIGDGVDEAVIPLNKKGAKFFEDSLELSSIIKNTLEEFFSNRTPNILNQVISGSSKFNSLTNNPNINKNYTINGGFNLHISIDKEDNDFKENLITAFKTMDSSSIENVGRRLAPFVLDEINKGE